MRKSPFTVVEQIIWVLRTSEAGCRTNVLCARHDSEWTRRASVRQHADECTRRRNRAAA